MKNSLILIEMLERSFELEDLVKVDILLSKLATTYPELEETEQDRIDFIKEQTS